jgi:hypothetical protein
MASAGSANAADARTGGLEALEDKPSKMDRVWNRIPDDIRRRVVMMAFEQPELSPREHRSFRYNSVMDQIEEFVDQRQNAWCAFTAAANSVCQSWLDASSCLELVGVVDDEEGWAGDHFRVISPSRRRLAHSVKFCRKRPVLDAQKT